MSGHSHYKGKSYGRLLHFLWEYCSRSCINPSEIIFAGKGLIKYFGKPLAIVKEWREGPCPDAEIPVFEFICAEDQVRKILEENQKQYQQNAIDSGYGGTIYAQLHPSLHNKTSSY